MVRDELADLSTFAAVAEARSFTRAAGRLGMSQSALSHAVRRLESRLGVRLLTRTSRAVAPTEAGERLLDSLRPALAQIDGGLEAVTALRSSPAGTLRITSADHVAETRLWPALRVFLRRFPEVKVDVTVDNALVDVVADRFDAGVRLGANIDRDMIAVPIGPEERQVVVGSPDYLAKHRAPASPDDLSSHACITRRMPATDGPSRWRFVRNGQPVQVRVSGQLAFNRPEMIIEAALDGFGLACVLESQVSAPLADGRLVAVLEDWSFTTPGYHLYYPSRRHHPPAFQLLIDHLRYSKTPQA